MTKWNNQVVVVTGGSSGLGKAIAQAFATEGARVVVVARDRTRNHALANEFDQLGLNLRTVECDVTADNDVAAAVEQVVTDHGQIDVWVNCVGTSTRIAIREATIDDYVRQMECNFYSAVRCSNQVLEQLEKTSGHLVNIGSLASKTAWPFMGPYSASKHALAAFTQQLRVEGPDNIHYLLVCPGPICRADQGTRYSEQAAGLPAEANQPGAGAKIKGLQPEWVAKKILAACEKRKPELVLPWKSRLLFSIAQLSPRWGDWLLKRFR